MIFCQHGRTSLVTDRGPRGRAGPNRLFGLLAVLGLLLSAVTASLPASAAETPELSLPIRCQPGRDCWLVNLVDHEPGPGVRDYACGRRSYDGHKGTDIAIRDLAALTAGVEVLAAAAGAVKAVRDGMADIDVTLAGRDSVKGRECGNGVVIDHGAGWETQYCHMRKGSVAVKVGEKIAAGARLGLVGQSGDAQFPHVHLSVRYAGRVVDPFAGASRPDDVCGLGPHPLWRKEALARLGTSMTAVFNAGFHDGRPAARAARSGELSKAAFSRDAPALVLWADMYWPEAGDVLTFRITGPDGKDVVDNLTRIEKTQARRFAFAGRKRPGPGWPAGSYRGEVTLSRGGGAGAQVLSQKTMVIQLR